MMKRYFSVSISKWRLLAHYVATSRLCIGAEQAIHGTSYFCNNYAWKLYNVIIAKCIGCYANEHFF